MMGVLWRRIIVGPIVLASVLAAIAIGCSVGDNDQGVANVLDERYDGWRRVARERVVLHFPPDHPYAEEMDKLLTGYPEAIAQDAQLLQIRVPDETLHVAVYTGPGQAQEMTGHPVPFVDGNVIHYWQPHWLGKPLMEYLIPYWNPSPPSHRFLREGLITLMDHSHENHHSIVAQLIEEDKRLSLDSLMADTTMDHNRWRLRSQQAASFVDFVLYMYGMKTFRTLWDSSTEWESLLPSILGVTVHELDSSWADFVRQVSEGETPSPFPRQGNLSDSTDQ